MATVMSAFLVDLAAAVKVVADDKAGKTMGVADEAGRLHAMLRKAASFAGGAEEREMQDADVRFWVHKLRELAYHVEDAVDTYALQAAERREMEQRAKKSVMHRMAVFLIVNRSEFQLLKHRMKSLVQKMDDILMTAKQLQIVQIDQRDEIIPVDATNQDCIVRNDAETAGLIESLTKEDKMTSVVAIIGLGGLGKTTIARKIHDDQQIVATFCIRLWVCVGLLSSIVAAAGGVVLKGVETRAQLQRMLAGIIKGKRFLLVLDDVWCGRTYEELIQSSLRGAAEGSRILVTARSRSVAEQMKACHIHKMPALTDNASFSLLYQTAGIADEHVNQGIISDAADKIVKSCNNLPMAIQIMGGILRTKVPSALEWLKVHESEGWSFKNIPEGSEGVMRAICLSYVNLPSHLKQCFIYCCSLFPAGSAIARSFITRLWITEGLARCKGETTAEEVADGYYKELVFRSLLQPQPGRDDIEECTVHYIVHSFAQFLTRDEILATNVKHLEGFSIGIHCLSVANRGLTAIPDEVRRLTSLRTLLLFGNPLGDHALAELFRRLHYLRVLDLSATAVEHIPENIGNLRYLRYLNVSQTRIRKLPDSLGSLKNLSHLDTKNCDCLHSIPEDIRKLCNLRYLDLEGTAVEKFPQNIANLQQLSLLHGFVANKADACQREQTGWSLAELKPMTNLRSLQLLKLERALVTEAEKVLIGMIHLKELQLCCSTKDYDPREHQENTDELTQIKALFDNLCPPASVESLQMKFYYGKAPVWMSNSHLCNLQKLAIFECNYIDSLSDMSVLLKLRSLSIINCQKLQHIELGRTSKIEELHLKGIPELEFLSGFDGVEQPRLQELRLENCPKLKALPAKFKDAQKLTRMEIRHACSLQVISEIPALEELVVEDAPELTEITSLAALKVLTVRFCKGLAQLKEVASLCHLHFEDDQMTELPRWLRKYASGLQSLKIVGRVELLDNCSSQEGLRVIRRIGVVSANLPDGTAYFSYSCSSGKVWFLQRKDNPVDTATLRCFDMPVLQDSSNKATVLAYNSNVDLHWLTTIKEITIHPLFVTLIMSLVGFLSYHDTFLHERLDEPVDRQDLLVLFAFVFLMQSGLFKHLSSIWKMFSQIVDDARKRIYGIARIKEKVEGIRFDVPNMLLLSFCCIITLFSIHNMIHMKLLVLLCMLVFVYSIFVLALVILKVVKGR